MLSMAMISLSFSVSQHIKLP